jgi:polysaccharide export outer membrane protein
VKKFRINKLIILFSIILLLTGCAKKEEFILFQTAQTNEKNSKQNKEKTPEICPKHEISYKIAPRDKLDIQVFNYSELTTKIDTNSDPSDRTTTVSSDGTATMPLLGRIKVSGLTKEEASLMLQERYKEFLKQPEVRIEILNQRIYVLGEVNKPGVVPLLEESISLIEAIAQAGDINIYGERRSIKIIRGDHRNPTISSVDLTKLESLRTNDLMLSPGNVVYVEPNDMRATNVNIGEYLPMLQLVNSILSPFTNIKYLTD